MEENKVVYRCATKEVVQWWFSPSCYMGPLSVSQWWDDCVASSWHRFALNGNGPSKPRRGQRGSVPLAAGQAGGQAGGGPQDHVTDWQGTGFIQWLLVTALAAAQLSHTGHSSNRLLPLKQQHCVVAPELDLCMYVLELLCQASPGVY